MTEWDLGHGGLSTFNREFCVTLAELGADVFLRMVHHGHGEEHLERDTLLHLGDSTPRIPERSSYKLGTLNPDVVIGHDRISGPQMMEEAENFFVDAKRILFVHTDPRIEAFSDFDDKVAGQALQRKLSEQDELLRRAQIAVGVGPRLFRHVNERASGFLQPPRVLQFDPAFRGAVEPPQTHQNSDFRLLLMARSNDVVLKGRAVASAAAQAANSELSGRNPLLKSASAIQLGICGVSEDEIAQISRKLGNLGRVTGYMVRRDKVAEEFRRAHLVLLPSYEEGFGLVALEALQANRPILATSNSGFAEFLHEWCDNTELRKYADAMIVNENSAIDGSNARELLWQNRIIESIQAYDRLVEGVTEVRRSLETRSWEKAVDELVEGIFNSS